MGGEVVIYGTVKVTPTCGKGATGSKGNTTSPTRKMPPINSEVAIGRLTNGAEMLMRF